MANPIVALVLRDNQDEHRVASRSDRQVAVISVGPGRMLNQVYISAGRYVEQGLGLAAHKLGMTTVATSSRIEKAFGDDLTRQSRLDRVYDTLQDGRDAQKDNLLCALRKDCQNLLEYALPSQTLATQIETFKQIIRLTTRYPGLRRIFLQSLHIAKVADSPVAICEHWQGTGYVYDEHPRFLLDFAANCLARMELNVELEGIRPSELGCIREGGLGVVDQLVARYCSEGSGFPRLIAIRYVAGILELPGFWTENYQVQKFTMDKLCKQTLGLIEDINPETVTDEDCRKIALLDPEGIDALAEAILTGGKKWIERQPRITGLGSDYWLAKFVRLLTMLRGLTMPEFLPAAYRRAQEDWEENLKDIMEELLMSRLDYEFEDVYDFVTRRSGILPDLLSRSGPSEVVEESVTSSPGFQAPLPKASPSDSLNTDQMTPGNTTSKIGNNIATGVREITTQELSSEDVVIVLMGPTGTGRSSFIELATGIKGIAGDGGKSITNEISVIKISVPEMFDATICLVDTPGFDNTNKSDIDVLRDISDWLNVIYKRGILLAGVLYFHRITDNRMAGTPLKNIRFFEKLCGPAFSNIVLTTTMWDEVDQEDGEQREREMRDIHWKSMIHRGSSVKRFLYSRASAFDVLQPILTRASERQPLLLQREMTDMGKKFLETTAGRVVAVDLEGLIHRQQELLTAIRNDLQDPTLPPDQLEFLLQEYKEVSAKHQLAMKDLESLKIPPRERFLNFFGVKYRKGV